MRAEEFERVARLDHVIQGPLVSGAGVQHLVGQYGRRSGRAFHVGQPRIEKVLGGDMADRLRALGILARDFDDDSRASMGLS